MIALLRHNGCGFRNYGIVREFKIWGSEASFTSFISIPDVNIYTCCPLLLRALGQVRMESIICAIKPSTASKTWNLNMIPKAPNKVYLISGDTQEHPLSENTNNLELVPEFP